MKRLLKTVLVTCGVLTVLCVAAVAIGCWQANAFPELQRCRGRICYSSIVMHETSRDQALMILRRSPELKKMISDSADIIFMHTNPEYSVQIFASNDMVVGFSIKDFKQPYTLIDILSRLGRPCSVFSDYGSPGYLLLSYPDIGVYIQAQINKIMPESPVFSIFTEGYNQGDCPPEQQLNHGTITGSSHAWRGLVEFYGLP